LPTNISVLSSVAPGGSLPVSWTLSNQGSGLANTSTTELRISTSSTSSGGPSNDKLAVSAAQVAAHSSIPQSATLTAPTAPGTYFVWVVADNLNTANQGANTGNDLVPSSSFTVVAPTANSDLLP